MTNTKKFGAIVPIVTKPASAEQEIIPTPAQMMTEDGIAKKKAIYHQPPKHSNYAADRARYNELCSDTYKITLGYPMSWPEFNQISDSLRKEYIESMLEKYPGIRCNTLAYMFNINNHIVKSELDRLGICISSRACVSVLSGYKQEIDEIKAKIEAGESPRNLHINRKEDLTKLKRKSYKQVKAMDPEDALKYINGIYERYSRTLSIGDFSDMLACSKTGVIRLFEKIGFKLNSSSKSFCLSNDAKIIRAKFREEMIESSNSNRFSKRKHSKSKNKEEPVVGTETIEAVIEPESIEEKVVVETAFAPVKEEVPMAEFYDPASVMDGCIPADKEIEHHDPIDNFVSAKDSEPAKPEFSITSIDVEVDADKIGDLIKYIGLTGKVKIHIEKI